MTIVALTASRPQAPTPSGGYRTMFSLDIYDPDIDHLNNRLFSTLDHAKREAEKINRYYRTLGGERVIRIGTANYKKTYLFQSLNDEWTYQNQPDLIEENSMRIIKEIDWQGE